MREIECTPTAHCSNVCGLSQTVIFLWDVLMIFHAFWPLWDFHMGFHAFWSLSQTRSFKKSRGFVVGGKEVMQRPAWESSEIGGRGVMGNFLRRGESRLVEHEVHAFCYIIRSWQVMIFGRYEVSLWDFMLFGPYEISRDFLMSFHAFWPHWDFLTRCHVFFLTRCHYELCEWDLMLVWPLCDVLMRWHAFWLPKFL